MSTLGVIKTAEELLRAGDIGRCELVRGELRMMSPAGFRHGRIAQHLAMVIANFVYENDLGEVTAAETGFIIARSPDTVRAPDVGFVRKERLAEAPERGFFPGAPDVAVEVLSPDDRASEVLAKVRDWLSGGAAQVWVVDPEKRTLSVYRMQRGEQVVSVFSEPDEFVAEDPLRGLRIVLRDVLS